MVEKLEVLATQVSGAEIECECKKKVCLFR